MAEPMSTLSPEKLNAVSNSIATDDDIDMTSWHDPPSSPFVSHLENEDQENVAPSAAATPGKPLPNSEDHFPQSAFKISPEKKIGLKERIGLKKASPIKQMAMEHLESSMSSRSRRSSPTKSSRNNSVDSNQRLPLLHPEDEIDVTPSSFNRSSSSHRDHALRDNEGLTVAMRIMEQTRSESHEQSITHQSHSEDYSMEETGIEDADFNPDGPELTSLDIDDTGFSMFSEMPGIDMTKFAALRQSPTRNGFPNQVRSLVTAHNRW